MGRYNPAPFSPHHAFVALRAFTYAAVDYNPGDAFPAKDVPDHRLRQMFDGRKIGPKGFGAEPPAYLENGRGKADALSRELAAENSTEQGVDAQRAQPRSGAKPAAPQRPNTKKPPAAPAPRAAKAVDKRKPTKPAPKRAAR